MEYDADSEIQVGETSGKAEVEVGIADWTGPETGRAG